MVFLVVLTRVMGVVSELQSFSDKFKHCLLSHLHTSGQSLCEVSVIVGFSVSESQMRLAYRCYQWSAGFRGC